MEKIPSSETDSHLDHQEIPQPLWSSKAHYRVYDSPPLFEILGIQTQILLEILISPIRAICLAHLFSHDFVAIAKSPLSFVSALGLRW
jgi:hypothetical protein